MAKEHEEKPAAASPEKQQAPQQQQQRPEITIDDASASVAYANFCRVTGTPEELIIDFALNPQPIGAPLVAMHVTQRLIVNYYTAKRLLAALNMSIQRHEQAFGVLETDIQKRLVPGALRQAQGTQRSGE